MVHDFNEFSRRSERDIRDDDMPDGMRAQRGIGDLEEDFRAVTAGFEDMHERVPEPMVEEEPADVPADPDPVDPADPVDLDDLGDPLDFGDFEDPLDLGRVD